MWSLHAGAVGQVLHEHNWVQHLPRVVGPPEEMRDARVQTGVECQRVDRRAGLLKHGEFPSLCSIKSGDSKHAHAS